MYATYLFWKSVVIEKSYEWQPQCFGRTITEILWHQDLDKVASHNYTLVNVKWCTFTFLWTQNHEKAQPGKVCMTYGIILFFLNKWINIIWKKVFFLCRIIKKLQASFSKIQCIQIHSSTCIPSYWQALQINNQHRDLNYYWTLVMSFCFKVLWK